MKADKRNYSVGNLKFQIYTRKKNNTRYWSCIFKGNLEITRQGTDAHYLSILATCFSVERASMRCFLTIQKLWVVLPHVIQDLKSCLPKRLQQLLSQPFPYGNNWSKRLLQGQVENMLWENQTFQREVEEKYLCHLPVTVCWGDCSKKCL